MPFLLAEILNFKVQHTLLVWEVLSINTLF